MKQTPILLSTPMVQATLDGSKTITRRLNGLNEINKEPDLYFEAEIIDGYCFFSADNSENDTAIKCPYGDIGDILWVRETWANVEMRGINYKADYFLENNEPIGVYWKWKPSIFLPKAHARIWLQIKNIRVERLHSITEADIKAEGIKVLVSENNKPVFELGKDNGAITFMPQTWWKDATTATDYDYFFAHWAELWCKINGRPNWNLNPWVWVIEFERVERPV